MKASLQNIKNEMENILDYVANTGIAFDLNSRQEVAANKQYTRITWQRGSTTQSPLAKLQYGTWQEYFEFVNSGRFSFMMNDGSFFFLSYEFMNRKLIGHSLLFYPCPAIFNAEDPLDISLLEMVDFSLSERDLLRFRSPIRIDFDSKNASLHHPKVHMHLNTGNCRAGLKAPLSPSMFISTMLRLHYFEIWENHEYLQIENKLDMKATITSQQMSWAHVSF